MHRYGECKRRYLASARALAPSQRAFQCAMMRRYRTLLPVWKEPGLRCGTSLSPAPPPCPLLSQRAGQKSLGRRVDASRANVIRYRSLGPTRCPASRFIWKSLLFPRHRPSCIGHVVTTRVTGHHGPAALQRRWYATGRTRYSTTRLDSAKNPRDDVAGDHNKCENNRTLLSVLSPWPGRRREREREGMSAVPECIIRALMYSSNYGGS